MTDVEITVRFLPFGEWVWPSITREGAQGYHETQPRRGTALRQAIALLIAKGVAL